MSTTPANTPTPVPDELPKYTASGVPVTRAYRIAFQIWVMAVLLTLVVTLVLYLIDKITLAYNK